MDPRFVGFYERELKHVRELGGEFAKQFPKIAGRLGLDSFACADPYVERLIEAFAFLTARIQLKLSDAHGDFTQHMIEQLYPGYLAPTPSMAVMQLEPNAREARLTGGVLVPRGAALRSALGAQQTACEFRTAHPVTLWPIELVAADYRTNPAELVDMSRVNMPQAKAALRLVLRSQRDVALSSLPLDVLPVFLRGGAEVASRLYEQLLAANIGMVAQSPRSAEAQFVRLRSSRSTAAMGFDDDQALLPAGDRSFSGYRLLHELFAFPERFSFVELRGLRQLLSQADCSTVELVLLFDRADPRLEGAVNAAHFALHCTPAINLFPRSADRSTIDLHNHEHQVVPDRTRPLDFEVHSVTKVVGYAADGGELGEFSPLYAPAVPGAGHMRYTLRREPRALRAGRDERDVDARLPYVPSEAFVSLVDGDHGGGRSELRQLAVSTLCTNRALPLKLVRGEEGTLFTEQSGAPIAAVRCVAGPTPPRASTVFGELAWGLISHLTLDYRTLLRRPGEGASALRELLGLYAKLSGSSTQLPLDGILDVRTRGVVRPLGAEGGGGALTFARGIEISVTCDESAFAGTSAFLLGAVLERFFAKYASINSFAETVLCTQQRGEVMRWPVAIGKRSTL
jgi:type VI secretion system protein ImpG